MRHWADSITLLLVEDRVFSPTELRSAYYSDDVVFAAADNCLSVRWIDSHNLEVMCRDRSLASHQCSQTSSRGGRNQVREHSGRDCGPAMAFVGTARRLLKSGHSFAFLLDDEC